MDYALLVIAKEPVPGRVKTRLCPPCTPDQAAELARAALLDTLDAVAATPAARRVLVFEGDPTGLRPEGFTVVPQRGAGLGERLAAAFADTGGPALLVGMDSPQLTSADLTAALRRLAEPEVDAVIAPTFDGGYWCIGFNRPVPGAFLDVPMSTSETFARQCARLDALGLNVAVERRLVDVDDITDARLVAAAAPDTRFARAFARFTPAGLAYAA